MFPADWELNCPHDHFQLDEVSGGQAEWKEVLRGFWPEFESVVASSIKVPIQKASCVIPSP